MKRKFVIAAAAMLSMVAAVALGGGKASAQVPPPVASTGGPYTGVAGVPVQVSAVSSTGFNLTFTWNWGDNTASNGAVASHVYLAPGVYTATVTVTDGLGRQSSATTTITIVGSVLNPYGLYPYGFYGAGNCVQTLSGIYCGGVFNPYFTCFAFAGFCGNVVVNTPVAGPIHNYNVFVPGVGYYICSTTTFNPSTCVRTVR